MGHARPCDALCSKERYRECKGRLRTQPNAAAVQPARRTSSPSLPVQVSRMAALQPWTLTHTYKQRASAAHHVAVLAGVGEPHSRPVLRRQLRRDRPRALAPAHKPAVARVPVVILAGPRRGVVDLARVGRCLLQSRSMATLAAAMAVPPAAQPLLLEARAGSAGPGHAVIPLAHALAALLGRGYVSRSGHGRLITSRSQQRAPMTS